MLAAMGTLALRHGARGLLVALLLAMSAFLAGPSWADEPVVVEYFYGDGCPYCAVQAEHMEGWADRFPTVEVLSREVWNNSHNREIFLRVASEHGVEPRGVPMTFIEGRVWSGFDAAAGRQMDALLADLTADTNVPDAPGLQQRTITLPFVGEISLAGRSLVPATILIALVDGFNPCSLWVLTVLLAVALRAGSRRDLMLVGGSFLLVTGAVYGLFIAGLFTAFTAVGMHTWIRVGVALIALAFAAVNLKDAFWFKRGFSLTIPEHLKPGIVKRARSVALSGGSPLVLVGSTALLALGVSIVELPCTAGFPMLWTAMLSAQDVSSGAFASLLGLYLAIYLADEIAIFLVVVITLRAARLQEEHGQTLKLVGGMLMVALAGILLFRPETMEDPVGALSVIGAALGLSAVIEVFRRRAARRSATSDRRRERVG
jgi:thiol-disulfide isomerase/thioredoxin